MKKGWHFVALSIFPLFSAWAGGPEVVTPPVNPCFDGLYLGLGLGTQQGLFTTNSYTYFNDAGRTGPINIQDLSQSYRAGGGTLLGTLFVGYGRVLNPLYLGAEIWATGSSLSQTAHLNSTVKFAHPEFPFEVGTISSHNTVALNKLEGGLDGRIGWLIKPTTMLYARVGMAFNQLKLNSPIAEIHTENQQLERTDENNAHIKSIIALRVGGGIEHCLNKNWSLRADYIYTSYGSIEHTEIFSNVVEAEDGSSENDILFYKNKTRLTSNTLLFSLTYYFNDSV